MINQWAYSASNYFLREVSQNLETLPVAVYKVEENMTQGVFLTRIQDKFDFPYKVYGIETSFINRVKKTYDNTKGNLGMILNGVKGTGKTVTAKQICNTLNLPVIIISHASENIPGFINDIQQNVIIFIDEYEKIYSDRDHSVLTVMDGALDNGYRKVFLLTTNQLYVNDNLLQRPGRVRYVKTYKDLSREAIEEIVDDKLINKEFKQDVIDFIANLETITVDIVKAIIDEVNIHEEIPTAFEDVFNIEKLEDKYDIYKIVEGKKPELMHSQAEINFDKIDEECIGDDLEINRRISLGEIEELVDTDIVRVSKYDHRTDKRVGATYKVENIKQKHQSFYPII